MQEYIILLYLEFIALVALTLTGIAVIAALTYYFIEMFQSMVLYSDAWFLYM